MTQLGLPFTPPIGAQAAWHDHADQTYQPEPETEASRGRRTGHRFYSRLNATSGSTLVARRAGIQHAASATAPSSSGAIANVKGSIALTPKTRLFINLVNVSAPRQPAATPTRTSRSP